VSTVIAIDDSEDVLALIAVRLKPDGLDVVTTTNCERGLELIMQLQPDLVLLDVDMPGQTGLDMCRRLKELPATQNIPVIFVTGSHDVSTKVHGFDLGAVDYVTKPFHPAELRARVRAALRMKRMQDMLAHRARVDALTGLSNRAAFDERLMEEIESASRSLAPLSLLLLDLDHFKSINDTYGHPFGDHVLQRVGETLPKVVRPTDCACRYGGEELAVILGATALDGALMVAERIRAAIEQIELAPRGKRVVVTASVGVAESTLLSRRAALSGTALVAAADAALYEAKRAGRNCVRESPAIVSMMPKPLSIVPPSIDLVPRKTGT
jgi:diguanylate cyclase (GGDEF)-like protein